MDAYLLTAAFLGIFLLHGGNVSASSSELGSSMYSGSASGFEEMTLSGMEVLSTSSASIDIPNELISASSSSSFTDVATPHSISSVTTMLEPTPTPTPTLPPVTLEEAMQLAVSITMDLTLDMWTPALEVTFKLNIANAINRHCATSQCGTLATRKRSIVMKRTTSLQPITADDIVILQGYPQEVTVDEQAKLDVQFYVNGMQASNSSTEGIPLSKEAVVSAVRAFQSEIAQDMGVSILSITSAAPESSDGPLEESALFSQDILLAVLPGTLSGGFVLFALIIAIIVLIALWVVKRNRDEVLPVKVVVPMEN